jgi:hypothetical protein
MFKYYKKKKMAIKKRQTYFVAIVLSTHMLKIKYIVQKVTLTSF